MVGLGLYSNLRKEFCAFLALQGKTQYSQERLSVTVASVCLLCKAALQLSLINL